MSERLQGGRGRRPSAPLLRPAPQRAPFPRRIVDELDPESWPSSSELCVLSARTAFPVAQQIGVGDTALLFGGIDAQGGIGDWYVSNGVIEAIVDDVGIQADLTPVVGPGNEPPTQTAHQPDGRLRPRPRAASGTDNDQLPQMFTVGGLSTTELPHLRRRSARRTRTRSACRAASSSRRRRWRRRPCLDVVTDYAALGTDPFLTVTSVATNNCGVNLPSFNGLLDVFIWGNRSVSPSAAAASPPAAARRASITPSSTWRTRCSSLELPVFMGGPGVLGSRRRHRRPDQRRRRRGEVSYGLIGVIDRARSRRRRRRARRTSTRRSTTCSASTARWSRALGNNVSLVPGGVPAGRRRSPTSARVYVGDRNDVRSVSNDIFTEFATRPLPNPVVNGTVSGDVDAADTANVEATLLITRARAVQHQPSRRAR